MNFDIKTEQLGGDAYVISLAGEVDHPVQAVAVLDDPVLAGRRLPRTAEGVAVAVGEDPRVESRRR